MTTATRVATAIALLTIGSSLFSTAHAQTTDTTATTTTTTTTTQSEEEQVNTTVGNDGSMQPVKNLPKRQPSSAGTVMQKPKLPEKQEVLKNKIPLENKIMKKENNMASKDAKLIMARENTQMRIASKEAYMIEELREKFNIRQEELKQRMATREAALKKKLDTFKDKEKAMMTQNISNNLNTINKNRTDAMNKNLGTLANLLTRVKNIASEAATKGKDVTAIESAIDQAESTIVSAQELINTQAGNDYTLVVSSETKVKDDAKAKRDQLEQDLKTAHQGMLDARAAVVSTVNTLKLTLGGGSANGQ